MYEVRIFETSEHNLKTCSLHEHCLLRRDYIVPNKYVDFAPV